MLQDEQKIGLAEAARSLPPNPDGSEVSPSTPWRWGTRGIKDVRLEMTRLGGRWYTSKEALQRFGDAVAAKSLEELAEGKRAPRSQQTPPTRTSKQRDRDIAEAEASCQRRGI